MRGIFLAVVLCMFLVYGCSEKSSALKSQNQQDFTDLKQNSNGNHGESVSEEKASVESYLIYNFDRDGFVTKLVDNRLWVFKEGSKELEKFENHGELEKHVIVPAGGPMRVTIKAPDKETIDAYLQEYGDLDSFQYNYEVFDFSVDGFVTKVHDNRLWVFKEGSKDLEKFEKHGELEKHVIVPAGGPLGITLKAPDKETIDAYLSEYGDLSDRRFNYEKFDFSVQGFVTKVVDNRLWVFKEGSKELEKFEKHGELAKHVIVPAGGPMGVTIKAPDKDTIDEYISLR